ncbi:MAG: hypothetical protein ABR598_00885 [Candidatus Dormibacteria bacterium]
MTRARIAALLPTAAAAYVVLNLFHVADHVRQGRVLSPGVTYPGTAVLIVAVALTVLAFRRSRVAAPLAVAFGAVTAIGLVAVHLVPAWGTFSDSYLPLRLDAVSWLSVLALLAAGVAVGICGVAALRARPTQAAG